MMRPPFDHCHEDYSEHWKDFNVKGKKVLDLGCDAGSTAWYFLNHGAISVVGVDINKEYIEEAELYPIKNFTPILMGIDSAEQIEKLIETYKPDVVKVDIEHAESALLDLKKEVLCQIEEWTLEVHSDRLNILLLDLFTKAGYKIILSDYFPRCENKHGLYVFTAKKV
jgi:23S rRNA U2552 (ribose-2'-O)-methylase RlmE/FtsJ